MNTSEKLIWLQERTALGILETEPLEAIAQVIEEKVIPENERLFEEETPPDALYILLEGKLESNSKDKNNLTFNCGLLAGAVINLQELVLDELTKCSVTTLSECRFWIVPAEKFKELIAKYPQIQTAISRELAQEVAQLTSALNNEQERSIALRPYLVTKAQRGVVGTSRYAVKLREQIREAADTRESILIFGEPGLEKDNIAALIHFGSDFRRQPIIKVDCGILQTSGADLFGRVGGKPGLIAWLEEGTLILNNIQETPPELLPKLAEFIETGIYKPTTREGQPEPEAYNNQARILIISEQTQPIIQKAVDKTIKAPPVRVRKGDIRAIVEYYISLYCRQEGIRKPKVTPEALRRLQSYDFPGNLKELKSLVERAIVQADEATELTEEIFWSADTKKKRFRFNLLNAYPGLRKFLRSSWYPDWINYGFTLSAFAVLIAILFLGPQTRDKNFGLNLFWACWWPFFLFLFPFLGRIWCAFCPFMIYGEVTQKLSLWLFPRKLQSWPRHEAEKWGGWFLFAMFALIFLWEELWDLENTAYLSACLLLLITAGAMICSAIFERRFWCRYLCPIGGMNGLFAKLSMTELRAQQGICSASCTTYQCYKGGPQKGEGLETNGCPLYSHPAQLEDNKDCVLCMTCLKACPHRSVEFNLRPPGIELWTTHVPHGYEVALLFLLLGGVYLHRLPEIQEIIKLQLDLNNFWQHSGLSLLALIIPAVIPFAAYGLMQMFYRFNCYLKKTIYQRRNLIKPKPFVELAYGYLPLILGGSLAHYLRLGLNEAGRILPVTFATFGLNGASLPILIAHPAVIAFLQGTTLIFSTLLTVLLTQKIARQPLRCLLWQHLASIGLAATMWAIIVSP
ncbi:sigma 54-interacting transcriptional regulator [Calothrix sp. CCY 0018]|uniref:sigma 54-interacting transcriptional regulator n=1 Tax=Calothrix sp. CCY 0018 TaxID=3103864 RepID=UPI0039C69EF3